MKRFAKLYERDGLQALVTIDEDRPAVIIKFTDDSGGLYLNNKLEFKPKDGTKDALKAAWAHAEAAFDDVGEEHVWAARYGTLRMLGLNDGVDCHA